MQTTLFLSLLVFAFALDAQELPVWPNQPANWITNTFTVPPGWSLIANPYHHNRGRIVADAVPDNSIGELFQDVPQGTRLSKFDSSTQQFSENLFRGWKWSNPSQTLIPGEGTWIFNHTHKAFTVTFTGNCGYGGNVDVPAGWSLISSPDCGTINFEPLVLPTNECTALECQFDGTVWVCSTDTILCPPGLGWDSLAFDPQQGDLVYTFDQISRQLQRHTFENGAWDVLPVVGMAESCFVLTSYPRTIRWIGMRPL